MLKSLKLSLAVLLSGSMLFTACEKDTNARMDIVPAVLENKDANFYVVVGGKKLSKFSLKNLTTAAATMDVDGMESGETLLGIDFRPATGQLYGLGSTSRLYVINPMTGKARAVNTMPFSPAISGTMAGFDFNPTVDRIRVVTNTGQNLRLNPETGMVAATDLPINGGASPMITGAAYTNNKAGVTTTVLYDIDVTTKKLYKQDPPNNGVLVEVGNLGVDISGEGGFDIAPDGAIALAAYGDKLYYINIETGAATMIGTIGGMTGITGLAIMTDPVAYAVDNANNLLIFNPMSAGTPISKAIAPLAAGETIEGIDFRPANGQLYALSSLSKIYTVNTSTGAVAAVGSLPAFSPALSGTSFGFDFNPTVDRIRVVSNNGQNLRLHPETGAVAFTDLALNPTGAMVTSAAYTNNFAGATTTVLYDIDAATSKLFKQDPPNNGVLVEVGSLGVTVTGNSGFDIGGMSNMGYAILSTSAGTKLYSINITTGAATAVMDFPSQAKGFALGLGF